MNDEEDQDMAKATLYTAMRIKELLEEVVPGYWPGATLEVVASGQDEDHLCSIVGPIRNSETSEVIHELPEDLLEAIEDNYLAHVSYGVSWKRCTYRLGNSKPGYNYISTQHFFE